MPKKFNARKCPYAQLAAHDGIAMVLVESTYDNTIDRMRLVSSGKFKLEPSPTWYERLTNSKYVDLDEDYYNFSSSCFDYSKASYENNIKNMKEFDKAEGFKIIHIDFY